MAHNKVSIQSLLNSSPQYRFTGYPTSHPKRSTFVFLNEAHFLRCRDRIAGMDAQPFCAIFDTKESREALEEKHKAKFLAFTFAIRQTHRHIAVCTETLSRPQMMQIMMGMWKGGRNCFWMTEFKAPAPRPHLLDENLDKIVEVVNHLSDEASVRCYIARLKGLIMGDPGYQEISPYWQYWHPEVHIEEGDILCDAGVGSSASASKRYAQFAGPAGYVYAFEPIPSMCEKLVKEINGVANLDIVPKGVWSENGQIEMFVAGDISTFRALDFTEGKEKVTCQLTTIDDFFQKKRPSIIKMDIEGAETNALRGAEGTIRENAPKLQVCLYHSVEDFVNIPLQVLGYCPSYKLYVGHHTPFFNECVMYARKPAPQAVAAPKARIG